MTVNGLTWYVMSHYVNVIYVDGRRITYKMLN